MTLSAAKRGNSNLTFYLRKNIQRFRVHLIKRYSLLKLDFDELDGLIQNTIEFIGALALCVAHTKFDRLIKVEFFRSESFWNLIDLAAVRPFSGVLNSLLSLVISIRTHNLSLIDRYSWVNRWSNHSVTLFRVRAVHLCGN